MHAPLTLWLLALAQLTFAQYNVSTITNSNQINAAISEIAASYFPSSIIPSLAVAIGSASVTGDPPSLISELVTASAPPPYLSALPPRFQSRLQGAESKISSLHAAVLIATARPPAITATLLNGTVANVTQAVVLGTGADGGTFPTTVPAQVTDGVTLTSAVLISTSATPASGSAGGTAGGSGAESSGFAVPTQVPIAAAGLFGVLGLLAAL